MADSIFEVPWGGGWVTIGDPITGGTANEILFGDGSGNVAQSSDLFWDDALKIFNVWDFGLSANKTYIALDDQNSKIDLQTKGTFKAGDVGAVGNGTLITLDDTTWYIAVGKTASWQTFTTWDVPNHQVTTYVASGHYIDMLHNTWVTEHIILRGWNDVGSVWIDNIANQVKFVNWANKKGFLVDYANSLYQLWDIDTGGNHSFQTIDDANQKYTFKSAWKEYMILDVANREYYLGEPAISGSKWYVKVTQIDASMIYSDSGSSTTTKFTVDWASSILDVSNLSVWVRMWANVWEWYMQFDDGSGTLKKVFLNNTHFTVATAWGWPAKWFDIDLTWGNVVAKLWDIDGNINSTLLTVDDTAKTITQASLWVNRVVMAGQPKTLVDNTTTSVFEIALPASGMTGWFFTSTVTATDGTDFQAHSDHVTYSAINKSGSYTTAIQSSNGDDAVADSAGTLAVTWTMTTGTNKVIVQVNANSSLTAPTINLYFNIDNNNGHVLTLL